MNLIALPIILPLIGAAVTMLLQRSRPAQAVVSIVTLSSVIAASVRLLQLADTEGIQVARAGGWAPPMGISLVVDRFSGIMLVVAAFMLLAVMVYAVGQAGRAADNAAFYPVYLVLAAGVSGSFISGDLFNLFVAFELMLASSYVLLTIGGRMDQVRSGMTYVIISLIASTLFLVLLAMIYAATGTMNMADLAVKFQDLPSSTRVGFSLMMILVFGIKAALFPLFFWLPDSYPTAPGSVTAIFAGLLTKVGVYAIIRTQTLIIPVEDRQGTVMLVLACLTMTIGVFGAIAQDDMKRILSFHIVSQIGYMVFGLGLLTLAGLAGAIFYIVHHILVKTSLFLVGGLVERTGGSSRLSSIGGLVRDAPAVALLFAIPALSLAGMPPFSGFIAKFALIEAGIDADAWVAVIVSLVVSALTLFSMTKIWAGAFWGVPEHPPTSIFDPGLRGRGSRVMVGATATVVASTVAVAVFAGPLFDLAHRSGEDLLAPERYVGAVLGGENGAADAKEVPTP